MVNPWEVGAAAGGANTPHPRAESKPEMIELTKRFLAIAGDGETEIRQVYEAQQ